MIKKLFEKFVTNEYHKYYYNNKIWKKTNFLGVPCRKSVSDMWNYQEIISDLKPSLVVEFGTKFGGSALFFSTALKAVNPLSKVVSVDVTHKQVPKVVKKNQHIELLTCSSLDRGVIRRIQELKKQFKGKIFAILDSDHHKGHVLAEMESLRKVMKKGDYLVVEDSNIGHPVLPDLVDLLGEGPMEAINEYFQRHPDDYVHDHKRGNKFGFTFSPKGFLIRK